MTQHDNQRIHAILTRKDSIYTAIVSNNREYITSIPSHLRNTHDIEVVQGEGALGEHQVVPPLLRGPIPPVIQVDHDLRLGRQVAVLDAPGGRVEQPGEVGGAAGRAGREEHAGADLVADGDDPGRDPGGGEPVRHAERVVVQPPGEGVDPGRPAGRRRLVAGVRPRVAEVQVEVHVEPGGARAPRQAQVVLDVVLVRRPDALPDDVHAGAGEDLLERPGRPAGRPVRDAAGLLDGGRRPVHAPVRQRGTRPRRRQQGREEESGAQHPGRVCLEKWLESYLSR